MFYIGNNVGPIRSDFILDVFFEFISDFCILLHRVFSILYPLIFTASHVIESAHDHVLLLVGKCTHILYFKLESSEVLGELVHHLFFQF